MLNEKNRMSTKAKTYHSHCCTDGLAREVLTELHANNAAVAVGAGDLAPGDADLVGGSLVLSTQIHRDMNQAPTHRLDCNSAAMCGH